MAVADYMGSPILGLHYYPSDTMPRQWERANRPPAIPYSIRELPWVSAWLAGYERL